jgi:hypothetical protein
MRRLPIMAETRRKVKVVFRLERDKDGYPPVDQESVWAYDLGNDEYEIGNIPFYAPLVSLGDVVSAHVYNGELFAESWIRGSGNSTVRVILLQDDKDMEPLRAELKALGCSSERSSARYVAVNVPPEVSFRAVQTILKRGAAQGRWGYEESAVSEAHLHEVPYAR